MALAPVGAPAVGAHDLLDRFEVGPPLHPPVLVDGDVGGVALVRGAEQGIVARRHPHLDREEDGVAVLAHPLDHPPGGLGPALARHPVLHLGEPDPPLAGEDPVAAVGDPAARGKARREPRGARDRRRNRLGRRREGAERPVLEHDVVEVGAELPPRARLRVGAVPFEDEGGVRVGKGEELEVVVGLSPLGEGAQHLFPRHRPGDHLQGEGGNAAEGDGADRAQRPDPDPRRPQQVGLGVVELADLAVGRDQLDRDDLGREVAELRPGAVGPGRDRAGDGLAVDVAEVLHRQAEAIELLVDFGEGRAGADPDQARGGVGVDDSTEGADVDQRPVGHRRLGEGVARADDADLPARLRRRGERRRQLVAIAGRQPLNRPARLVAGPVAPLGRRHRSRPRTSSAQRIQRPASGPRRPRSRQGPRRRRDSVRRSRRRWRGRRRPAPRSPGRTPRRCSRARRQTPRAAAPLPPPPRAG